MFVELIDKRKKHFARLRAEEQRRKPPTKAQKRSQMSTYLKHMARYKQNQLKRKNYNEIQKLFDKVMTRVNMFVDMDTELVKESSKKAKMAQESSSKRPAEMKKHMEIVPDDEVAIDAIPLATKPPIIVDWKIIKEGKIGHIQIIRVDGSSRRPEEGYKRELWGDLKVMFEPDVESENLHIFMLVEKKYPLTPATITEMLNKKLQADH
ncbi:hypothetical protein Tco_1434698 [Tanacetum coccineum]